MYVSYRSVDGRWITRWWAPDFAPTGRKAAAVFIDRRFRHPHYRAARMKQDAEDEAELPEPEYPPPQGQDRENIGLRNFHNRCWL